MWLKLLQIYSNNGELYEKNNICFLCAVVILIAFLVIMSFIILSPPKKTDNDNGYLSWIKEESYFVDYSIVDSTVKFRYSICFENTSEYDFQISPASAGFQADELKEWVAYEKSFEGYPESDEYYTVIPSGKKSM